jgi:hypothetical protein
LNVVAGTYTRTLELPAPLRDVQALRTLILLDLESHPPPAAVERVTVVIDPTPGRVLQHTLFTRAHPTPEQLATLIARLTALMGQDRIGRPAVVDSTRPGPLRCSHLGGSDDQRGRDRRDRREKFDKTLRSSAASALNVCRRCAVPPPRAGACRGRRRPAGGRHHRRAGSRVDACSGAQGRGGLLRMVAGIETGQVRRVEGGREKKPTRPTSPTAQPPQTAWNRDEWDVWLSDGVVPDLRERV